MNKDIFKQEIIRDEGKVGHAYQDSEGYLTIGVGKLVDQRLGGKLDDEVIDLQLDKDIDKTFQNLDANLPWWRDLDEVRQRAIANLWFNLGNRLLGFPKFLDAMRRQSFGEASEHLRDSLWHKQVGARAIRLESMIANGEV